MKKDRIIVLLLSVLLLGFGLGVGRLFQLRFDAGDVYPPYSSLRADPLGTKALLQSLQILPGITAQRFFQQLEKLPEGRHTTLFVFGAQASDMDYSTEEEYKQLEQFMLEGGRLVISFAPVNTRPWAARRAQAEEEGKSKEKTAPQKEQQSDEPNAEEPRPRKRKSPAGDEEAALLISLKERWNVSLNYEDLPKDADDVYHSVLARKKADLDLPVSVIWHTALYFERPGANWNVIYARDKLPVLIERKFGSGSLVFSADSFFVSNEALRSERHPKLLAWLGGPNTTVLFDETHLGVLRYPVVPDTPSTAICSGLPSRAAHRILFRMGGAAIVERSEVAPTISLAPQSAQGLPGSAFSKPHASQVRMAQAAPMLSVTRSPSEPSQGQGAGTFPCRALSIDAANAASSFSRRASPATRSASARRPETTRSATSVVTSFVNRRSRRESAPEPSPLVSAEFLAI